MKQVRTRIAPSPTGDPHVGTAYMALFNMIFARRFGGKFILRIEDTDQTRSRDEYEKSIYEALRWTGLTWDEGPDVGGPYGPYRQSERTEIYRKYAYELLAAKKAYKCFATPEELAQMREVAGKMGHKVGYDRRYRSLSDEEIQTLESKGRPYVLRLKMPLSGTCVFQDKIKGRVEVPYADIDDQVLLKSDRFPTYHLANVVDDHLMEITHVLRGDEWLSSTPKHIVLYEHFGWTPPEFYHLPLLLDKQGKKLSKRKSPTSIQYYRDVGFLPEAFSNFLTLMGYSMESDQEIYSIDEIAKVFNPERFGASGAIFDTQKLEWVNQQYLMSRVPENEFWPKIRDWGFSDAKMEKIMPLCRTRMKTFAEFMEMAYFFFVSHLTYSLEDFTAKQTLQPSDSAKALYAMILWMDKLEDWNSTGFETASKYTAGALNLHHKKAVMPALFAAITGKTRGLPLFDSVNILGKFQVRARLLQAIEFLGGLSSKAMDEVGSQVASFKPEASTTTTSA